MTKLPFRAVLLDCDGVLYDGALTLLKQIVPAVKSTALDMGIPESVYEATGRRLRSQNIKGLYNLVRVLCAEHNLSYARFCAKIVACLQPFYNQLTPCLRTAQLLAALADRVDHLVIYTNNHFLHVAEVIDRRGFGAVLQDTVVFDVGATADANGVFHPKPLPQGYLMVLAQLGVQPHEAVMVDDAPHNIAAARHVGMQTVHISPVADAAANAHDTAPSLEAWLLGLL
ncbi:MAG: HAD-IA family hydrolase [Proteobacteria bacterium]|nr:HAD-IA family hydrolase [Pseudomonadota bacterium]